MRKSSMHPKNSRSRVGKKKYKKEIFENFQDLMKSIESQIKKHMCTYIIILIA